jgi:N-acetylglucosamine-6-phosphate deacetylase
MTSPLIVVRGGDLILPGRILSGGSVLVDDGRIVAIEDGAIEPAGASVVDARDCYVAPGFIDVHLHGLHGDDVLDGEGAVARVAAHLPRHGVTAFCPTSIACPPDVLRGFLRQVGEARLAPPRGARVLPAHLESNFISPDFAGAQPASCLRLPPGARDGEPDRAFTGRDVLDAIEAARPDVGIVTLAPELPGGLDLVRSLAAAGHRVSLGHSGADVDTAMAAIEAGARQATHLFNRMPPMSHRAPGLAGAVLASDEVTAELICDGHHVHPAACRVAIAAKGPAGVMAITDATAGAGLAAGATARLGGQPIHVRAEAAFLEDGTLAGSTLTMDRAFAALVARLGVSLADAALMCATTPARALGLTGVGVIADGAVADLVVLDRAFRVRHTLVGGDRAYRS